MKWLAEILLGAALLASVFFLVAPRPDGREASPLPAAAPAPQPTADPQQAPASEKKPAAPELIASLFGWQALAAKPSGPAAPAAPTPAPWLKPIGFVVGEAGAPTYVFKDTRSNAVLSLVPKVQNKGWVLQEIREKEFLLVFQGTSYVVKR